ncbi:MAG: hypothetical protein DCC65_09945 [Planctomycetota bacterium]|nr:MAG: hypothetical protein DCC65_09945 [Planctomycetota bacterium]
MPALMDAPRPARTNREPLRLVCSEIWGGNRPIHSPVELPGICGVLYSNPCHGRHGGDVHYLSVCGTGILSRVCLADVVGHGETVAAVSDEMHAHLRRCMNQPDQRKVLSRLNDRLHVLGFRAMTTAAALTYYTPTRRLSVSYAGHPPGWYFSRAARSWSRLEVESTRDHAHPLTDAALAIDSGVPYSARSLRVALGDRIVFVTDGVLETPGIDGDQYGEDRIAELLNAHRDASCEAIGQALLHDLERYSGMTPLHHDDVTFLIAEFVPGPAEPRLWLAVKNRITRPRGNATAFQPAHRASGRPDDRGGFE